MHYLGVGGHRPNKLGGYGVTPLGEWIRGEMKKDLIVERETYGDELVVITGMALGVDQWMAELCVAGNIKFQAAIPFEGQESLWPKASQERYHMLLTHAYDVHHCYRGKPRDNRHASNLLQARNEWVVAHSDEMLFVFNGVYSGGTANAVRFAQAYYGERREELIAYIRPQDFRKQS